MTTPRVITITVHGPNNFDVADGGLVSDRLTWDEMLGQVAHLTHERIGTPRYKMLTAEERAAEERKWAETPDAGHLTDILLRQAK